MVDSEPMRHSDGFTWAVLALVVPLNACSGEGDDGSASTSGGTTTGGVEANGGGATGGGGSSGSNPGLGGSSVDDAGAIGLGSDDTLQIWTVGDSITEGVNNGYRNGLWAALTNAGYDVDLVGTLTHPYPRTAICPDADHDGHSGYTIGDIRAEIDGWYSEIIGPDVALVMAGTNDIAWWVAPGADMADVADEMLDLINHMLDLDSEMAVIVATIPPMSSEVVSDINRDRAELTIEYNDALLTKVAAHPAYGSRLWSVDVHSGLTVDDLYDGIHPDSDGHDKLADVWLAGLQPRLPAP